MDTLVTLLVVLVVLEAIIVAIRAADLYLHWVNRRPIPTKGRAVQYTIDRIEEYARHAR